MGQALRPEAVYRRRSTNHDSGLALPVSICVIRHSDFLRHWSFVIRHFPHESDGSHQFDRKTPGLARQVAGEDSQPGLARGDAIKRALSAKARAAPALRRLDRQTNSRTARDIFPTSRPGTIVRCGAADFPVAGNKRVRARQDGDPRCAGRARFRSRRT